MRKLKGALVALAVLAAMLLPTPQADAAVVNWSDVYPTSGTVTIEAGQTVRLDVDVDLSRLVINGILQCAPTDVELRSRTILVNGEFRCGSNQNRHTSDLTITLTGAGNGNIQGFGDKYFVARPGATVRLFGETRTSWVRLTQTAPAGATSLQLEGNDWRVGDQIVIAPTDFDLGQAEDVTIVARNGNAVTIDRPLSYMHYCGTETYASKSLTECAEVGLLTRNITIRGDAGSEASQIGGHAMFHQGSLVRIDGVEVWRMGQIGRVGRYPMHFHKFGDATDSWFRNNSIWRSYNRWLTMHGVQNLRVVDNVGYDTLGHGFYLEDGDEIGNRLIGNLGVLAKGAPDGQLVTPSDNEAATFWIANPDNTLIGNVAAGADHSGFWYSLPERPLGDSTADLWPRRTPLGEFRNNVAHSVGFAGLMVDRGERPDRTLETTWYNPVAVPSDPNSELVPPRFVDFTTYKSRHYGMWVRTFSGGKFIRMNFADNWRSMYLANIRAGAGRRNIVSVENSLMVGETQNVGQPESWEATGTGGRSLPKPWEPDAAIVGVPFYDGPLRVRSSVFANFAANGQRDAGALSNLFPNPFWVHPSNGVWDTTFVNSRRVLLPDVVEYVDGDATAVFIDWAGAVTGRAGAAVTVQDALVDNDSCTRRDEWNAMVCPPSVGYLSVSVHRLDGRWARLELQRDDGRSFGFDGSDSRDDRVYFTMMNEMQHRVVWEDSIPQQFNLYVSGEVRMRGRGARIIFPAPSGDWNFQVNGQRTSAPNLAALDSGPSNWYYDSAADEIHVRLVGDNNWVQML